MISRLVTFVVTSGGIFVVVLAGYGVIAWLFTLLDKEDEE